MIYVYYWRFGKKTNKILIRKIKTKFSISAPPSSIEIQGYNPNAKVEVRENQDLTLTCIVADAKPAAQIVWFRNNLELKSGN